MPSQLIAQLRSADSGVYHSTLPASPHPTKLTLYDPTANYTTSTLFSSVSPGLRTTPSVMLSSRSTTVFLYSAMTAPELSRVGGFVSWFTKDLGAAASTSQEAVSSAPRTSLSMIQPYVSSLLTTLPVVSQPPMGDSAYQLSLTILIPSCRLNIPSSVVVTSTYRSSTGKIFPARRAWMESLAPKRNFSLTLPLRKD